MKTSLALLAGAALAMFLGGCSQSDRPSAPGSAKTEATPAAITPVRPTSFTEVTSQLDAGGSVYAYLATDQWLAQLSTNITQLRDVVLDLPEVSGPDREKVEHVFSLLASGASKSGLEQLNGIGLSGIQITPELHRTKLIVHHGAGNGGGVLWNIFGKAPHALCGLDLLTENTALASFGDVDAALLWQFIEGELSRSEVPELADAVKKWPAEFERRTRVSWTKLLASFGGEAGLVLTLDPAHQLSIPFGKQSLAMPEPGLLMFAKVNDELIYDRIASELLKNEKTTVTEEKGLRMCAMPVPVPLALKVQVTIASAGGYLFVASSPDLVRQTLAVRDGKQPGLRKSETFQTLAKHLPAEGNQLFYSAPLFSQTVLKVQKQLVSENPEASARMETLQKFLFRQGPSYGLCIAGHTATGWQSVSVGNRDSASVLVAAPLVSGAAVMSAMLLPAMAKAKTRAQDVNCINNLKQACLAFRIWEADNNNRFPFNVSTATGGTLELCDRNAEGFDRNSFRHFQVMSNVLNNPRILVCPQDSSKTAAAGFANLGSGNVSYLVHTGTNVDDSHPYEILVYCPVHHNYGYVDGAVFRGKRR